MTCVKRCVLLPFLLLIINNNVATAQLVSRGYLPQASLQRVGLKAVWTKQIASTSAYGTISDVLQFVSADKNYTVHEIEYAGRLILISERDVDSDGKLLGKDRAARVAKQQMISLQEAGHEPTHLTRVVPEITFYLTSTDGLVHALDAETGRRLWSTSVVKKGFPVLRPAANEETLAVIGGSSLLLLKRESGQVFWKQRLTSVPAAGPAISRKMVFTIASNGLVEAFRLEDLDKAPWGFQSMGRGTARPRISASTISWSTDYGHLYVGDAMRGGVKYRLEANGNIHTTPAFVGRRGIVTTTEAGLVYGLDRLTGNIRWRTATGFESRTSPIAVKGGIYVVGYPNGISRLDAKTGEKQWRVGGITKFVAAGSQRVFCLDNQQRFVALDPETGKIVGVVPASGIEVAMTNTHTDRIVLGTKKGLVQFIREAQTPLPVVYVPLVSTKKEEDSAELRPSDQDRDNASADENTATDETAEKDSPFDFDEDNSEDPFGDEDNQSSDEEDPFGGAGDDSVDAEDPFGGAADDEEDPFG